MQHAVHRGTGPARWVYVIATAALAAYFNYLFFAYYDFSIALRTDSLSYLQATPIRTIGYPLLLRLLQPLEGFPAVLAPVQLNLMLLASGWFVWRVGRLGPSPWLALPILITLWGHADFLMQALSLLSEALFTSLLLLHFAAAAMVLEGSRRWPLAVMSVTALAAILVRPAGYFLLPSLLLFAWFTRRSMDGRRLLALTVPLAAGLLLASAWHYSKFGVFNTQAFAGYSLVGHVAWAIEPDPASRHPQLSERISERLSPIFALRPAPLSFPYDYQRYTSEEYGLVLWPELIPEVRDWVAQHPTAELPEVTVNRLTSRLAHEAIARRPEAYAHHVAAHFLGLVRYLFSPPGDYGQMLTVLAEASALNSEQRGLPPDSGFAQGANYDDPEGITGRLYALLAAMPRILGASPRALSTLFVLLSVGAAAIGLTRTTPLGYFLAYAATAVNGYLLLVASVQVALPRYATVVMPLAFVMLGVGLPAAFMWAKARLRGK